MPSQNEVDKGVRLEVYRFFAEATRAPAPVEIARNLELGQAEVEDSLRRLDDAHMLVLAPGTPYIWMANPFSALPTPFTAAVKERRWFGNCIWDALGIVAMLGGSGTVRTSCPDCSEEMQISIENKEISAGEGTIHFAIPAAHWWDDIGFN